MMVTSILDLFEGTVSNYPSKIAFQDVKKAATFQELQQEAKAIGSAICKLSQPKRPIAVYMEKGVSNIAAFLGCVYAGCFYVSIDKDMPDDRVSVILDCLKPDVIICDSETEQKAQKIASNIFLLGYEEASTGAVDDKILENVRAGMKTTDILYVLFTSGSTGLPKGVTISHAAVLDFAEWICDRYGLDEHTSLCNQAPFYFDASVPDIYIPLKTGATVFIPPKGYYMFPSKILQFIEKYNINTLIWVPSALCTVVNCHAFDVCIPKSIKLVIFCGEVMPCKHLNVWKRYVPEALYVNMYGPTEATYACMYYEIKGQFSDNDCLPLGKPCENSEIILITNDNRQAGVGEIGELCILGQCLSQGYFNDRERTKEVFVQNPLNPYWTETMYRTGDLAYTNEDGDIIFVGRKDFQIKRLGYRIELGEIETAILSLKEIRNACCLFNKSSSEIIAVYTGEITERELSAGLHQVLPQYMLPNRYICLKAMPLNLNGKIDRIKLYKEYVEE